MTLAGARFAVDGATTRRGALEIPGGTGTVDLSGLLLLPGLINAHDHLEFNLFPRLGRRIYGNASEWAADIHHPHESPVREHLSIPPRARLIWGGIRNLLSGVPTVAHHNPYDAEIFEHNFPLRVMRDFAWAHSVAFSPDLVSRFRDAPTDSPFIIHAAEGTDRQAASDIERLEELGVLAPHTVLVHAMGAPAETLLRHKTSVVWCPRSNLATYGKTLPGETLRSGIPMALGTDSAITTEGDLIDEIRTAVSECGVGAETVYRMVTSGAAEVLRLRRGEGSIREGGTSDMVAVADEGQSPAEAILHLHPEFVMVGGRFKLLSERMASGPLRACGSGFHPIRVGSRDRCFIDVDVPRLHEEAVRAVGSDLRLAGRSVRVGAAA